MNEKHERGLQILREMEDFYYSRTENTAESIRIEQILWAYNQSGMMCNLTQEEILSALEEADRTSAKVYILGFAIGNVTDTVLFSIVIRDQSSSAPSLSSPDINPPE